MNKIVFFCFLSLFLFFSCETRLVSGQEKYSDNPGTAQSYMNLLPNEYTKEHYNALCLLLQLDRGHHSLPRKKDQFCATYSTNYGLVRPILREIYLKGESALPVLPHFFDKTTYLFSISGAYNIAMDEVHVVTVGQEAKNIFLRIVDPTSHGIPKRLMFENKRQLYHDFLRGMTLEEWWKQNKEKSLSVIQKDILDFYIEEEKRIGFPDKESEKTYLVPLLELRTKLPFINPEYLNDPTMPCHD